MAEYLSFIPDWTENARIICCRISGVTTVVAVSPTAGDMICATDETCETGAMAAGALKYFYNKKETRESRQFQNL